MTMTKIEVLDMIQGLIDGDLDAADIHRNHDISHRTYREAGIQTLDDGLVLTVDGDEYQLTLARAI